MTPFRREDESPAQAARTAELFNQHMAGVHSRASRMFAVLMVLQVIGAVAAALWVSPLTWIGEQSLVHRHVWIACLFGPLLASLPVALALSRPDWWLTRHTIGVAQMLFSAMLIHLTGGRIETHFHVFGSLAFLAFYRDWKVLVTATVIIAADHLLRGELWPQSVFGSALAGSWRWLEHALWVVFIDIFLLAQCLRGVREVRAIAHDRAQVENSRDAVEAEVHVRTRQLAETQAAAESANRAKSMFLANMSHEIRTPMAAILGYAELLRENDLAEHDRQMYLSVIRRNGDHLVELINEILDLSKIEAGKLTIARAPFRLDAVVAEVESTMRVRAADKGLDLKVEFCESVPLAVESDAFRLRQILVNLLGNAIKFTDRGSVRLVARSETDAERGRLIAIDVIDTGVGLTPEQVAQLFKPFSQVDSSTTRRHGGTGLGLVISRRLAEMLGGDLTVCSEPGRGSTFTLTFTVGHPGPENSWEARSREQEPDLPACTQLDGRILLAEDGPDNQRLINTVLSKAGAQVHIVGNGRLAVEAARSARDSAAPFDLILMDMQMPELDGYDATRQIRTAGIATPIIALTAHAMDTDRAKCLRAGCDDYATKPIARPQLIRLCARWLAECRRPV